MRKDRLNKPNTGSLLELFKDYQDNGPHEPLVNFGESVGNEVINWGPDVGEEVMD